MINDKTNLLKHGPKRNLKDIHTIILHHTGGMSLAGAVSTLQQRGLSYHYIIDRDGTINQYVGDSYTAWHASGFNNGTIGISFVGGGTKHEHAVSPAQFDAGKALIEYLNYRLPSVRYICGHRHRTKSGKWDPQLPLEIPGQPNRKIENVWYNSIITGTDLIFDPTGR